MSEHQFQQRRDRNDWSHKCLPVFPAQNFGFIRHSNLTLQAYQITVNARTQISLQLFIVLKKKNSHLSFLHCYHHFFMAMGTYIAARWVPGGHALLLGLINLFVHAFMYFYYFLTAIKPELKQSIWWKKHITQIQLVIIKFYNQSRGLLRGRVFQIQFAILMVGFGRACFADTCDFPKFWLWTLVIQNSFMFALFSDFYRKTYLRKNNSLKNKWRMCDCFRGNEYSERNGKCNFNLT